MILLTVGTLTPFDRLVRAIDQLAGDGFFDQPVVAQIGTTRFRPRHMDAFASLERSEFEERIASASYLIAHAGMGTIFSALEHHKALVVVPRLKRYGEHVNDHQVSTARKFAQLGHVLAAFTVEELPAVLSSAGSFAPKPRVANPEAIATRIQGLLETPTGKRPEPT